MTRATHARSVRSRLALPVLLLVAVICSSLAVTASGDHPVVGRFSITSEAGGAVWAFQPGGALIVIGPGEIVSEGTWTAGSGAGDFDATVDMTVSGQILDVLGQVSPDGGSVAVYVTATQPERPDDWTPWPSESRLTGQRSGMITDPEASPTPLPVDCLRPEWVEGMVDWDRCDEARTAA